MDGRNYVRSTATLAGALLVSVCALPAMSAEVTQQRLENASAEPQNWLTPLGDFSNHRYSSLKEITRDNIGGLHVAFTMPIPTALRGATSAGLENPPLVIDGMMYVNDAWGTVYKVDITDGKTPKIQWVADPAVEKEGASAFYTRGIAAFGNRVFANLIDGRVIAVDADTGEIVWDQQVGGTEENWEFDAAEGFTAAPLAVDGKILVGQSKGDWGTRGYLAALNAEDGSQLWRTYTVPAPGEPGSETWKDDHNAWHTGGGSLWQTGAYDPEQKVTIWGTANPVPMFDPEFRPGDNLFTNSAIAFDINDGKMKWYFQYTPNDAYDYDEIGVHMLIDADFNGETRKMVTHFARNGFYYQLDRTNGSFISAAPFVSEVTWTAGIDPKTGKPVEYDPNLEVQTYNAAVRPSRANTDVEVCPTTVGGVRWQPPAYNPDTKTAYIAGGNGCLDIHVQPEEPMSAEGGNPKGVNQNFLGGTSPFTAPSGMIASFDVSTGQQKVFHPLPYHNLSGVLATGGGLIFTGNLDGNIAAYNDETLDELWAFNTGISLKAPPISFAIGDKQYIAIVAGGTAAPTDAKPNLDYMREGAMLYVFTL